MMASFDFFSEDFLVSDMRTRSIPEIVFITLCPVHTSARSLASIAFYTVNFMSKSARRL